MSYIDHPMVKTDTVDLEVTMYGSVDSKVDTFAILIGAVRDYSSVSIEVGAVGSAASSVRKNRLCIEFSQRRRLR